jgi:hypothetical protein
VLRCVIQPLDLRSLMFLMEALTPNRDDLDNANLRAAWSNRVRSLSPLILCLLDSVSATVTNATEELFKQCRSVVLSY